jgi:hypothetical protein
MAREEVIRCDKCNEITKHPNGGIEVWQDFETEDGGYKSIKYSELCKPCTTSLIKIINEWAEQK